MHNSPADNAPATDGAINCGGAEARPAPIVERMCRNITELRGLQPAATPEEIAAAARQYVRKVSGVTHPSAANAEAFEDAVAEVTGDDDAVARSPAAPASAAEDRPAVAPARGGRPAGRSDMTVTPALKEWSAVVHALLDGRQRVLLRKGGIGEKRFEVTEREFLLFPTVAHSHAERVRPEHRDLLEAAAPDSTDEHLLLRAAAKVVAALPVNRPEGLDGDSRTCISGRPSRCAPTGSTSGRSTNSMVLVVSAVPLRQPVRLNRTPEYAGCTSWVQLPVRPALGTPVHDQAALTEVAVRVRDAVG